MATIVGASPLTLVPRANGLSEYVYPGRPVPADADPDQVQLLLEEGHLVDLEAPAAAPLVELDNLDRPVAPARNASRDEWAVYAVVLGADEAALEGLGRNDIRDGLEELTGQGE